MTSFRMRSGRMMLVPLALAGALVLGACSDDGDATDTPTASATASETATETATATATTTETASATATASATETAGETIAVTAVDYAFEGVPETVAAGSTFALTNSSEGEVHEMVIFPIPADETRSVDELAALPQEELEALFSGPPAAVLVALPGEDAVPVFGTGEVTEPGRYVAVCTIPQGADPAAFKAAMESGSQDAPDVEGGPPHFTLGMYAGFTVE